ncbi:hypothetical protein NPIL_472211, partial [Nephila pilipes]
DNFQSSQIPQRLILHYPAAINFPASINRALTILPQQQPHFPGLLIIGRKSQNKVVTTAWDSSRL